MYSMEYNETALLVASDQYTWDRERLFTEITPTQLQLLMDGLKCVPVYLCQPAILIS